MNRFLKKLAQAATIAAVLCLVAGAALARAVVERPYHSRGELSVVGSCEVAGIPGSLSTGTENATHFGLAEVMQCVILTGGTFPVFTLAGRGVVTTARGDQISYSFEGTLTLGEDQCITETTTTFLGGTSHKGDPIDVTGEVHATGILPSAPLPAGCGTESTFEGTGTITY